MITPMSNQGADEYAQGGGFWAGVARRKLEDAGARYRGPGLAHSFELPHEADDAARLRLWFWDSVWCALTHPEPVIALRAVLQTYEYHGRLGCEASLEETIYAVRIRAEGLIQKA